MIKPVMYSIYRDHLAHVCNGARRRKIASVFCRGVMVASANNQRRRVYLRDRYQ
jgi:hypothetical protein